MVAPLHESEFQGIRMFGDSQLAANIPSTALQATVAKTWIKQRQSFAGQNATSKTMLSIGKLPAK
jgi:hypothetical protein